MGIKESMMNGMMGGMSAEDKSAMMNSMMDNYFSTMSSEDRQKMMNGMMDKFMGSMSSEERQSMMNSMMGQMMGGNNSSMGGMMGMMSKMMGGDASRSGGGMMDMMSQMMGKKTEDGKDTEMPWDMCKKMMSNMSKTADLATFATPEIKQLFEDWIQQIDEEIIKFINESNTVSVDKIAENFKLSKESVLYFLSRLAQKERINFSKG